MRLHSLAHEKAQGLLASLNIGLFWLPSASVPKGARYLDQQSVEYIDGYGTPYRGRGEIALHDGGCGSFSTSRFEQDPLCPASFPRRLQFR